MIDPPAMRFPDKDDVELMSGLPGRCGQAGMEVPTLLSYVKGERIQAIRRRKQ